MPGKLCRAFLSIPSASVSIVDFKRPLPTPFLLIPATPGLGSPLKEYSEGLGMASQRELGGFSSPSN